MNIDTDTQYAFTRPVVTHICENIEGVLKIEDEVGNKKTYDPRSYLKKAEQNMCLRMAKPVKIYVQTKTILVPSKVKRFQF